jgi:uncharacterized membrane protein
MALQPNAPPAPHPMSRQVTWWILLLPAMMGVALGTHNLYLLDWTHIMSASLWTGADLFLGFILSAVMRRLGPSERKAVIQYLVPRTILYLPVAALTTSTAGWYMAEWVGFLAPQSPQRPWIIVALVITGLLTVQGLGILLPNQVRIWRELQKPVPDGDRIWRLNRVNLRLAAVQGTLQVLILLVMAHLVAG